MRKVTIDVIPDAFRLLGQPCKVIPHRIGIDMSRLSRRPAFLPLTLRISLIVFVPQAEEPIACQSSGVLRDLLQEPAQRDDAFSAFRLPSDRNRLRGCVGVANEIEEARRGQGSLAVHDLGDCPINVAVVEYANDLPPDVLIKPPLPLLHSSVVASTRHRCLRLPPQQPRIDGLLSVSHGRFLRGTSPRDKCLAGTSSPRFGLRYALALGGGSPGSSQPSGPNSRSAHRGQNIKMWDSSSSCSAR
jgi:hypothetical protein